MASCYNGCWDSKTQARFDREDALLASIKKIEPRAHCTYFPVEEQWQVHKFGVPLSGMRESRGAALEEALQKIGVRSRTC